MRMKWLVLAAVLAVAGGVVGMAGCGVPREAGATAGRQAAALAAVPGDEAAVRTALLAQADAWNALSNTVRQKAAFGVTVGTDFVGLVDQTAALARRQRTLIQQGADDPAADRQALEEMRKLWVDVQRYLGG